VRPAAVGGEEQQRGGAVPDTALRDETPVGGTRRGLLARGEGLFPTPNRMNVEERGLPTLCVERPWPQPPSRTQARVEALRWRHTGIREGHGRPGSGLAPGRRAGRGRCESPGHHTTAGAGPG